MSNITFEDLKELEEIHNDIKAINARNLNLLNTSKAYAVGEAFDDDGIERLLDKFEPKNVGDIYIVKKNNKADLSSEKISYIYNGEKYIQIGYCGRFSNFKAREITYDEIFKDIENMNKEEIAKYISSYFVKLPQTEQDIFDCTLI